MFEFKEDKLVKAEMPEWLDLALVNDIHKGLVSQGYVKESLYGEENGFGVQIYERDVDKPIPWLATIDTTNQWHLVMLHDLPEYIAFLRYISPIATANLLSWLFREDLDVLEMLEVVKARFDLYHSRWV